MKKNFFKFNMPTLLDFANTSVVFNKYVLVHTYILYEFGLKTFLSDMEIKATL